MPELGSPLWETAVARPDGAGDTPASRRTLRDMAALLALPAIWLGHEPAPIVGDLVSVLFSVLRLDSAYARFDDPGGGPAIERWRPHGPLAPAELAPLLASAPGRERESEGALVAMPSTGTTVHVVRVYPSLPGEAGLVLAGAERPGFPTDLDMHLLRVAIGQATVSIRIAHLLATERIARAAAEAALQRRNEFLATLAQEVTLPITALAERVAQAQALAAASTQPDGAGSEGSATSTAASPLTIARQTGVLGRLTRREAEVLGLLAQGLSNKEIAAALWVSDRTVERHITGLYRKIGVQRRAEAITLALRHGLAEAHPWQG